MRSHRQFERNYVGIDGKLRVAHRQSLGHTVDISNDQASIEMKRVRWTMRKVEAALSVLGLDTAFHPQNRQLYPPVRQRARSECCEERARYTMGGWPSPTRDEDLIQPTYPQDSSTHSAFADSPEIPKGELKPDEYASNGARGGQPSRNLPSARSSDSTATTNGTADTKPRKFTRLTSESST